MTTDLVPASKMRKFRYRIEYGILAVVKLIANVLPERASQAAGALTGRLIYFIWRKRRTIAIDNIRRSHVALLSERDASCIAQETFVNMGRTAFEILRLGRTVQSKFLERIEINGAEWLQWASEQGRGAVLVSGHFGNWEIFGACARSLGYPVDFVVKPVRNPLVDAMYNRCRAKMGVGIIHTQTATRAIISALQRKRFVAILADQYAGADGVVIDFLGRPASTPRGPAALALKFGCPLITGVLERLEHGRFRAVIEAPIEFPATDDSEEAVRSITQEIARRLEVHIRRVPGQWLWTHRRWRDVP